MIEQERTTVKVILPATELERQLGKMIEMVREGRWCRDKASDSRGRHCTMGLIAVLAPDRTMDLVGALCGAIPEEDKQRLSKIRSGTIINGGTSRGWGSAPINAVCTYNNTIGSRDEIVAWYERALVGVRK